MSKATKVHHLDGREHIGEQANGFTGGKAPLPKHGTQGGVRVHDGMCHVDNGVLVQSVTKTQVAAAMANAPLSERNPLAPLPQQKKQAPVKAAFGMRSRSGGTPPDALHELGKRILANATRNYGPHEPGGISGKHGVNKFWK